MSIWSGENVITIVRDRGESMKKVKFLMRVEELKNGNEEEVVSRCKNVIMLRYPNCVNYAE